MVSVARELESFSLSMNRAPSPHPSPPMGERVPAGRVRGWRVGSWFRCAIRQSWRLPLNRSLVAQIFNLLYRGFSIRKAREVMEHGGTTNALPNAIRRYSRLKICATPVARTALSARHYWMRSHHFLSQDLLSSITFVACAPQPMNCSTSCSGPPTRGQGCPLLLSVPGSWVQSASKFWRRKLPTNPLVSPQDLGVRQPSLILTRIFIEKSRLPVVVVANRTPSPLIWADPSRHSRPLAPRRLFLPGSLPIWRPACWLRRE
jgi:hypothetical protein